MTFSMEDNIALPLPPQCLALHAVSWWRRFFLTLAHNYPFSCDYLGIGPDPSIFYQSPQGFATHQAWA